MEQTDNLSMKKFAFEVGTVLVGALIFYAVANWYERMEERAQNNKA